jgi:hypothetical protein
VVIGLARSRAAPEEEHHLASRSSAESGQPWLKTIGWPEPQSL